MNLQFLNQLSEEEILILINLCIASINEQIKEPELETRYVDYISIYSGEDSRDMNGNQYAYVTTGSNGNYIGSPYEISDFNMTAVNHVNPHLSKDFSNVLKEFMTKRFGMPYIQALHDLRVQEADAESKELSQYLGVSKK